MNQRRLRRDRWQACRLLNADAGLGSGVPSGPGYQVLQGQRLSRPACTLDGNDRRGTVGRIGGQPADDETISLLQEVKLLAGGQESGRFDARTQPAEYEFPTRPDEHVKVQRLASLCGQVREELHRRSIRVADGLLVAAHPVTDAAEHLRLGGIDGSIGPRVDVQQKVASLARCEHQILDALVYALPVAHPGAYPH